MTHPIIEILKKHFPPKIALIIFKYQREFTVKVSSFGKGVKIHDTHNCELKSKEELDGIEKTFSKVETPITKDAGTCRSERSALCTEQEVDVINRMFDYKERSKNKKQRHKDTGTQIIEGYMEHNNNNIFANRRKVKTLTVEKKSLEDRMKEILEKLSKYIDRYHQLLDDGLEDGALKETYLYMIHNSEQEANKLLEWIEAIDTALLKCSK